MPSSLRDLLAEDGFRHPKPRRKPRQPLPPASTPSPPPATASMCSNRRFRPNGSSSFHSHGTSSNSRDSIPQSLLLNDDEEEAGIDEAAVRAVVLILSGYAGRFLKDGGFRRRLREKCNACLAARKGAAHAVLANLELGIESIERLAEEGPNGATRDSKIRSLRNSIRLLSIVASLNSPKSRSGGYTCGVPNSHLSACAQLYLAMVYKIERNDWVSARHLLQVFVDAPFLARKNLLPDLWDHFFLPHLLHLKVWYSKEAELVAGWEVEDRDQRMKGLNRAYIDQMDGGTAQFALYYKEWLKVGGKAPPVPAVSLPLRTSYLEAWGKRSVSLSRCSINRNLYRAVFGTSLEPEDIGDGLLINDTDLAVERELDSKEGSCNLENTVHSDMGAHQTESDPAEAHQAPGAAPVPHKSYSFRLFSCRSEPYKEAIHHAQVSRKDPDAIARESVSNATPLNVGQAITLISDSDSLSECEAAVHLVAKAWLDSHGDSILETALSSSSVIEGLLEVTFTSKDDKVLELAISLLVELVSRNEVTRQVVLNADPQLEIFLRLLRSTNLFLKAAVVLYLLKPKAKQMLSLDWIPLVMRVLDNGDQMQTLFTVRCSPKSAALYFLDQLLMGFDVDRNVENAKQMVALGGLDLLIKRLEMGDAHDRKRCASLLVPCIQADGRCRDYLAGNIKKASIIQLLLGNQLKSKGSALFLLSELVCLNRTTQIIRFLKELKNDGCLNTMHVLLVYLQQAPLEQRPLAAAILLLLDLLGDPLQYSVYREEGIDAIVAALEWNLHHKEVQEQCSRALLLLGGRFSCLGETTAETWLLKRAGLDDGPSDSFRSKEIPAVENAKVDEEEKMTEEWLRKLAMVLLTSGKKRFLVALSNCIADGIPSLARSCLVTIAWMSSSLSSLHGANSLQPLACSILAPRLFESLNYDRALEERVLASLSLLNFVRHPECLPKIFPLNKEMINLLQDLAQVTWTAKELLFACCRCS
uniref:E3 ubiquitin-protein ligase LIN n=1 Tax=Elaeis guineensis var. tenera TaxID=51953 RepID=A0A6I9RR94_ELAGV|nr:putative E3 ubiquitin-protein ligase LIN [Elaeis guineensis]